MAPHERAKELVGRPPGLSPGYNGEVHSGARRANGGLGRLITPHTWRPLLQQGAEESGQGDFLDQDAG